MSIRGLDCYSGSKLIRLSYSFGRKAEERKPLHDDDCGVVAAAAAVLYICIMHMTYYYYVYCVQYFVRVLFYSYRDRPENSRQNKFIDYIMRVRPSSRIIDVVVATVVDLSVMARAVRPLIKNIWKSSAVWPVAQQCGLVCGQSMMYCILGNNICGYKYYTAIDSNAESPPPLINDFKPFKCRDEKHYVTIQIVSGLGEQTFRFQVREEYELKKNLVGILLS